MRFKSVLLVVLYCLFFGVIGTLFIVMLSFLVANLKKLAQKLMD